MLEGIFGLNTDEGIVWITSLSCLISSNSDFKSIKLGRFDGWDM